MPEVVHFRQCPIGLEGEEDVLFLRGAVEAADEKLGGWSALGVLRVVCVCVLECKVEVE